MFIRVHLWLYAGFSHNNLVVVNFGQLATDEHGSTAVALNPLFKLSEFVAQKGNAGVQLVHAVHPVFDADPSVKAHIG